MINEFVTLYALSVEQFQNYYVSKVEVLVHNYTMAELDAMLDRLSPSEQAQVLIMEEFENIGGHSPMQLNCFGCGGVRGNPEGPVGNIQIKEGILLITFEGGSRDIQQSSIGMSSHCEEPKATWQSKKDSINAGLLPASQARSRNDEYAFRQY